jgi:hypothetical protein
MGRFFLLQLDGKVYSCRICKNHLASSDQLVSKVRLVQSNKRIQDFTSKEQWKWGKHLQILTNIMRMFE